MNIFPQGMGFFELQKKRGLMKRKESSREKMGCFRAREVSNRLSYNRAPVIRNCSIMRVPGMVVVIMGNHDNVQGRVDNDEEVAQPLWPSRFLSSSPTSAIEKIAQ